MEPIPETEEAIIEFGPFLEVGDLLDELTEMGDRIREVVPDCVGLSLASREYGVTFTVVASNGLIAALDGLQYVDGGPCVAAADTGRVVQYSNEGVLGEESWHLFARGTAASGVASTLTLPIMENNQVQGSVNLYAASPDAFTGMHDDVAAIVGGWAPGAVTNADLSFSTRRTAQEAPATLGDEMRIQVAVGILRARWAISVRTARERLGNAAARAGVPVTEMARMLIKQATQDDPPEDSPDPPARP
jgi:GAF domain-containing protein